MFFGPKWAIREEGFTFASKAGRLWQTASVKLWGTAAFLHGGGSCHGIKAWNILTASPYRNLPASAERDIIMDIADSNRSDIPSISSALPGGARRTIIRFGLLVLAVTASTGKGTIGLAVWLAALPLVLRDIRWGEPAASGRLEAPVIAFIGACLVSSVLGFNVWVGMGHVVGLSIMAAVGLIGGRLA